MNLGKSSVVAVVCLALVGLALGPSVASAVGAVTGEFPYRTFVVTRTHSGGPQSEALAVGIEPTQSGEWWVLAEVVAGSSLLVEVWRDDAGTLTTLESSSRLRAAGDESAKTPLVAGLSYVATFTPFGKKGASVMHEYFVLWARQFGTPEMEHAARVAVDASGVYVAGETDGAMGQAPAGQGDVFLRKYDSEGNEVWTRQFGTPGLDTVGGFAVDATGVYVGGRTYGTLTDQLSAGAADAFLRKYDVNGNEVWTRQFGTPSDDTVSGIALDGSGVYVVGSFGDGLRRYDLDGNVVWSKPGQAVRAIAADRSGVYLAGGYALRKFDANGNLAWTRPLDSSSAVEAATVDASHLYLVGFTVVGSESDAYLRVYDLDGNLLSADTFGSLSIDIAWAVAADASGVYVAGEAHGDLPGLISAGEGDVFLRKYDLNGNQVWTRQFGTPYDDGADGVAVDASGVYVAGDTAGAILGQAHLGYYDAFVVKMSR